MLLKIWVVIISFISIVPLFLIAQNSPKDYLKAHNDERVKVGTKPLKWDQQLASLARKFVKKHIFDCKKGTYDRSFIDGTKYVQSFVYHPESISGVDAIICDATTSLGCARVKCRNYEGTLITCLYYPACHLPGQSPFKEYLNELFFVSVEGNWDQSFDWGKASGLVSGDVWKRLVESRLK
ncbi:pathogenesis-related protein 1-like [Arachis ipaensis]|uniref:pathogenesis-related protein 1-like n=1 Tax=Arachis ipaensis TaxID=130454 RepID=UPI000A2B45F6|nr:pathogenesis-related protein 1-like [Arachis ipaensis]